MGKIGPKFSHLLTVRADLDLKKVFIHLQNIQIVAQDVADFQKGRRQ